MQKVISEGAFNTQDLPNKRQKQTNTLLVLKEVLSSQEHLETTISFTKPKIIVLFILQCHESCAKK